MSEQNNNPFGPGGDINLGSSSVPKNFDPFAETPNASDITVNAMPETPKPPIALVQPVQADPEEESKSDESEVNAEADGFDADGDTAEATGNPLEQAMDAAASKETDAAKESIFSRAPQFVYANANENITDASKTFEDLRLDKSADFPELEDGKRVSWTVEYGKVTKSVADPKGTTIAKMKTEIETSTEFLNALKKMKPADREAAVCKIKPRVTAQVKGDLASYKGIFHTYEDAEASGKIICLIPSRDGQVYEMRKNEIGTFVTKTDNVPELSVVEAGFTPALPLIPNHLLQKVVAFFRSFMETDRQYEALVHILWSKVCQEYCVVVPEQSVSKISVHARLKQDYDTERFIHVMDIHSHNDMPAKFSATDDADEKATRLYAVIGRLNRYWPSISVRMSGGGKYLRLDPKQVFEDADMVFPEVWSEQVALPVPRVNLAKVFMERYAAGGEDV